jgi:lysozyme
MDKQRVRDEIERHEGRRYLPYRDSEGVLTIGVGVNLEDATSRGRIEALGIDYEVLCAGKWTLTDVHINALFAHDVEVAITDAAAIFNNFWNLPENAQLALVDMSFQLGKPRLAKFVKVIAAITAEPPNFIVAADEMRDSLWARQTPQRTADAIALVRGCAR